MHKASGLLCHLSSLPSVYGIGDLGPVAYSWIDHLFESEQEYWQVLPIGNTDDTGCPYSTDSAFGIAEFYVSPELLIEELALPKNIFEQFANEKHLSSNRVNYPEVIKSKKEILEIAFKSFIPNEKFKKFLKQEDSWIEGYCIYRTFKETRGPDWTKWPSFESAKEKLSSAEIILFEFYQFSQFIVLNQLLKLKKYANSKKVQIIGDLPIFVSYSSMDVWKNPEEFLLNKKTLRMELETGAAPDVFSDKGQKWGTPIYNWEQQEKNEFSWWKIRFDFLSRYFDMIRIDHFRGFCATWVSSVKEVSAKNGSWFAGPGEKLFFQIKTSSEIIAEDLGVITPDVEQLRDQFQFPGLRVLQFMLGDSLNPHKIKNYIYNSIAYSGTHDCDTLMGWYVQLSAADKNNVQKELDLLQVNQWTLLQKLMRSESKLVILQVQDVMGIGNEGRFNYPGTVDAKNWTWKLTKKQFLEIDWKKLKSLTKESRGILC